MRTHLAAATLLAGLVAGCASTEPPEPVEVLHPESRYLASPLQSYARSLATEDAERIREAHENLVRGGRPESARAVAMQFLAANPSLEPALVLKAQAEYLAGDSAAAIETVLAVAERDPEYVPAHLVLARAAEKLGRIPLAYESYASVEGRSKIARRKSLELKPRAITILGNRIRDLMGRNRLEEADRELVRVETWAPGERSTAELVMDFAKVAEDKPRELEAVRQLVLLGGASNLLQRQAELELEAGDAGQGLKILQDLVEANPADRELENALAKAKVRWRLGLLPEEVHRIFASPQLTRSDYAKILFWVYPEVRYGRAESGTIATDILDHEYRQEIVRVVNLGLMSVDTTLHAFQPDRPLTRQESLESLLLVMNLRRPRPACLGNDDVSVRVSVENLCAIAARCGLVSEAGACHPEATASGEFVERMGFAALDILGSR